MSNLKFILVFFLWFAGYNLISQKTFTIPEDLTVWVEGDTKLTLGNFDWANNGQFQAGQGHIVFNGDQNDTISGSAVTSFYKLTVDKAAGNIIQEKDLIIRDRLILNGGNFDLHGYKLLLQGAQLEGESESSRLTGYEGGIVETSIPINNVNSLNAGNLGLSISTSDNLDSTIIRRGHIPVSNLSAASNGISRYYEILPGNPGSSSTLRFHYLDAENPFGYPEGDFVLYHSTDGGTSWSMRGKSGQDTLQNWLEQTVSNVEGLWTIAENDYCAASGSAEQFEWIRRVQIGSIDHISAADSGYADYTNLRTDLLRGRSVIATLTPEQLTTGRNEGWSLWIDLNHDLDFDDPGELLLQDFGTGPVSSFISIPNTASLGLTRMRIAMQFENIPLPCAEGFYGEVEDYTINITDPVCGALPADWFNQDIGVTQYEGSSCFDDLENVFTISSAGKYPYGRNDRFHFAHSELCGDGEIIAHVDYITSTSRFASAGIMLRDNLSAGSPLVAMLKLANSKSLYEKRQTANAPMSAVIVDGAIDNWVRLTRQGNNFKGYVSDDGTNWTIIQQSNVPMGTCVRAGIGASSFITNSINTSKLDNVIITPYSSDRIPNNSLESLNVYPNPADNVIVLSFSEPPLTDFYYEIFDVFGKSLQQDYLHSNSQSNIEISNLEPGIYLLRIADQEKSAEVKFVKN